MFANSSNKISKRLHICKIYRLTDEKLNEIEHMLYLFFCFYLLNNLVKFDIMVGDTLYSITVMDAN